MQQLLKRFKIVKKKRLDLDLQIDTLVKNKKNYCIPIAFCDKKYLKVLYWMDTKNLLIDTRIYNVSRN